MREHLPHEGAMSDEEELALGEARAKVMRLAWELHEVTGRTTTYITRMLLGTQSMRALGSPHPRHMNKEQADECARLLGIWIEQAKERKRNGPEGKTRVPQRPHDGPAPPQRR